MSKKLSKITLGLMLAGVVLLLVPAAYAAEAGAEDGGALMTTDGARKFGGASAVESMARQPEASGQINTAMIITAALIEGVTLFAVVVTLLAVF